MWRYFSSTLKSLLLYEVVILFSGNGYVRSEAAVVVYLQKASAAKRVYATIVNAKTNTDGYKTQGITFPIGAMQNRLIREVYEDVGVNPHDVVYVEAHGTGTKVSAVDARVSTNNPIVIYI